jgi:very-short-patch-repair endonuclease
MTARPPRKKPPATNVKALQARARKMAASQRASLFVSLCRRDKIPDPIQELHFAKPERAWRFDFAWPDQKVALEVEGGAWTRGRHTRGAGFIEDMSKYNKAALLGWRVFRVVPSELETLGTVRMIAQALSAPLPGSTVQET